MIINGSIIEGDDSGHEIVASDEQLDKVWQNIVDRIKKQTELDKAKLVIDNLTVKFEADLTEQEISALNHLLTTVYSQE